MAQFLRDDEPMFADLLERKSNREIAEEKKRLEGELKRSEAMLSNERFLSKAPESKIAEEKAKQEKYRQTFAQVEERLKQLSK